MKSPSCLKIASIYFESALIKNAGSIVRISVTIILKPSDMEDQQTYYEQKLKYEVDSWDLREALKNGEKVVPLDARSSEAYEIEHIPGAINIPHRTMTQESTAHLDKEVLYISYCSGIGCNASTKGALKMLKLGFRVKN
jgi:rhodanese-related sulfurtransferase